MKQLIIKKIESYILKRNLVLSFILILLFAFAGKIIDNFSNISNKNMLQKITLQSK